METIWAKYIFWIVPFYNFKISSTLSYPHEIVVISCHIVVLNINIIAEISARWFQICCQIEKILIRSKVMSIQSCMKTHWNSLYLYTQYSYMNIPMYFNATLNAHNFRTDQYFFQSDNRFEISEPRSLCLCLCLIKNVKLIDNIVRVG